MDSVPSPATRPQVQTLDRVVVVLEAVAVAGPCSLADLVRHTGLARPTAYRLAVACEGHGLLARDEDGRFRLGGRLVGWGARAAHASGLAAAAGPLLAALVDETGESAQLYVREGDTRVCIATHERASGLRDTVPLGAVMPLGKGSGGKALLAWAADRGQFTVPARGARRGARGRVRPERRRAGGRRRERERARCGRATARSSPRSASADRRSAWARTRGVDTARPCGPRPKSWPEASRRGNTSETNGSYRQPG